MANYPCLPFLKTKMYALLQGVKSLFVSAVNKFKREEDDDGTISTPRFGPETEQENVHRQNFVDEWERDPETKLTPQEAYASLGDFVKGGKYQFLSELSTITPSDYIVIEGIQYVIPYLYEKRIKFHARWEGKTLLDSFATDEHLSKRGDYDYWKEELEAGKILDREDEKVSENFTWQKGKSVWHTRHLHEPPIYLAGDIKLVHVCPKFVVVNKPGSMAVHPCGIYKRNTLIYLLAAQFGFRRLYVIHRLDKQTSGVVMFGRSSEAAAELHTKNKMHQLSKTYLAEVTGQVSWTEVTCAAPLRFSGKQKVHEEGKKSVTYFRKLQYFPESDTTVIEAKPKTGRQHQIRVHIKHLGHPIVNDPMYGKGPKPVLANPLHTVEKYMDETRSAAILKDGEDYKCTDCPNLFTTGIYTHVNPICLHALRYEGEGFSYKTTPPQWAEKCDPEILSSV